MMLLAMLAAGAFELGELPPQRMAAGQCLTFLWTRTQPPVRIAMIDEAARAVKVQRAGRVEEAPRIRPGTYQLGDITLRLDLDLESRQGLKDGNIVSSGTVTLEQAGADSVVMPVAGIRGCR